MMARWLFVLASFVAAAAPLTAADVPGQWVVVAPPAYAKAIDPLAELRKAEGFRVVRLSTADAKSAEELRDLVRKTCRDFAGPSHVLLVGAVEGKDRDTVVPPLPGTVGRMKAQPSDNAYGCLDETRLPTVPVGRLPARDADEAKVLIDKVVAFERDARPDPWRQRLTVLAGIPAYNPLVDRLVENVAMARFDKIHPGWAGRAIYTNPASRFSLPDDALPATARGYVEAGQSFLLYLGHSNAGGLYAGGRTRFLDREDFAALKIAHGRGVFLTVGCNGCQLRGDDGEGYGVHAVRNPAGPVAVLGSHGVCYAAMVQLAADGLFESVFTGKPPERLGPAWLALKQGLAKGKIDALTYRMLDNVDGDPKTPQEAQRQEHLEMFVLLGDPALRLPRVPPDVTLAVDGEAMPGAKLTVTGTAPKRLEGAAVRLTLERGVTSVPPGLEELPKDAGRERDRVLRANHDKANAFVLDEAKATVKDGRFTASLTVPAEAAYPKLIVRAYAATDKDDGLGVEVLPVKGE